MAPRHGVRLPGYISVTWQKVLKIITAEKSRDNSPSYRFLKFRFKKVIH